MAQSSAIATFHGLYAQKDYIGSGASGCVYECFSKKDETRYAVKICYACKSSEADVIRREIEICKILDHKNIIKLIEAFEDTSNFYLIFEMMAGGDVLDDIEKRSKYTEYDASYLIEQVFHGVGYLHRNNIIHRDLKPENILLNRHGNEDDVKITDFGSAIVCEEKANHFEMLMTASYGAPEIHSYGEYGSPIDIWSCGVILFAALFGVLPFCGKDEEVEIENIKNGKYTFPSNEECEPVCDEAKDLIRKLLHLDPNVRYTAQDALAHPYISRRDSVAPSLNRSRTIAKMKAFNEEKRKCKSEKLNQPWRLPLVSSPKSKSDDSMVSPASGAGDSVSSFVSVPTRTDDKMDAV